MEFNLKNATSVLQNAGLKVVTKLLSPQSQGGNLSALGLILHHDAAGLSYVKNWDGQDNTAIAAYMANPNQDGAQFWVGRSGAWYILCIGYKWHAGLGDGYGQIPANQGNKYAVGVETDYGPVRPGWDGPTVSSAGYVWPVMDDAHRKSIYVGTATLSKAFNLNTQCAHKEYAPARKIDIANFDLSDWRKFIKDYDPTPKPPTPPVPDPTIVEYLMSLAGAPKTYDAVVDDIINKTVAAFTKADASDYKHALAVMNNKLNHNINADGTGTKVK